LVVKTMDQICELGAPQFTRKMLVRSANNFSHLVQRHWDGTNPNFIYLLRHPSTPTTLVTFHLWLVLHVFKDLGVKPDKYAPWVQEILKTHDCEGIFIHDKTVLHITK